MKNVITIAMMLLAAILPAYSQQTAEAIETSVDNPVLTDIISSYVPWRSVEFSGKLEMDKLPITPTVKIYMERDSLIQISLRVPMMGEVGRVEITPEEVLLVNKMDKKYSREKTERLMALYPSFLSDIQSVLLARVTVFGSGELSEANAEYVAVDLNDAGNWLLLPEPTADMRKVNLDYGYVVGPSSRTIALAATIGDKAQVAVEYAYRNRGMQMDLNVSNKGKDFRLGFDFESVKWGGTKMSPARVSTYVQVPLSEFFKF